MLISVANKDTIKLDISTDWSRRERRLLAGTPKKTKVKREALSLTIDGVSTVGAAGNTSPDCLGAGTGRLQLEFGFWLWISIILSPRSLERNFWGGAK